MAVNIFSKYQAKKKRSTTYSLGCKGKVKESLIFFFFYTICYFEHIFIVCFDIMTHKIKNHIKIYCFIY